MAAACPRRTTSACDGCRRRRLGGGRDGVDRPPSGDSHREALIDRFDALRASAGIPGVAVAIVRDGRLAAARGLGFANVEARLPVTPFDIASVAKPIAAMVALQLTHAGRLDLDRPMATFAGFGDFCATARTSPGPFFRDVDCADPRLTLRTVMSMAANGTPGTRFFYNPPLFSWASRPMAAAADTPYSTLVQQQVFDAAEMRRSARIHRQLALRADLAAALALPGQRVLASCLDAVVTGHLLQQVEEFVGEFARVVDRNASEQPVGLGALCLGPNDQAHADRRERQRYRVLRVDDRDTVVPAIGQDARHRRIDAVRGTFDALDKAVADREQHAGDTQRRVVPDRVGDDLAGLVARIVVLDDTGEENSKQRHVISS